jgi:PucR C-terminal helix-turn-helix domain/GGDEF-like domain
VNEATHGAAVAAASVARLRLRLEARREEIEEAVLTRLYGIADPGNVDPTYLEGLRGAVSVAIDHGLSVLEASAERLPPVPVALLAQARLAARNGVGIDVVLRRYFAGQALLEDLVVEEATKQGLEGAALKRLLRRLSSSLDRLIAAVSEEYGRESDHRLDTTERRRSDCVQRLLKGEPVDASGLGYPIEEHHLGIVAKGPDVTGSLRVVARRLDRRLLAVARADGTLWAWLGGRRPPDPAELERGLAAAIPSEVSLALGEPGAGLSGWRLTHRQAAAALPVVLRGEQRIVRYADVALLASTIGDGLLATSLHELFLAPLETEPDGGEALRQTLRSYFASGRHVSSTAAALGKSRQTVTKRLNRVEERIGRSLDTCGAELEIALRCEQLDRHDAHT